MTLEVINEFINKGYAALGFVIVAFLLAFLVYRNVTHK
jgi:hypothetical protein